MEKFDAEENCEEKLREVRELPGIAEEFDGGTVTTFSFFELRAQSTTDKRT